MRPTTPTAHPTPAASSASRTLGEREGKPVIGVGTASGKAILVGEHSVVYGHPAIALPLHHLRVRAEAETTRTGRHLHSALYTGPLDRVPDRLMPTAHAVDAALAEIGAADAGIRVRVESDLPAERGMGSSAAVAAAIVQAVAAARGRELSPARRHELIQTAERAAHTAPSGLDARTVVADSPVWFERGAIAEVDVETPLSFVIADTGIRGRTREAVEAVRDSRERDISTVDRRLSRLGDLARSCRTALATSGLAEIGEGMYEAHALLDELGVGDAALDALVAAARSHGALGAKLTGGGRGGCVLVLARDPDHGIGLARALRDRGAAATWTTELGGTR